jgi:MFS family permease
MTSPSNALPAASAAPSATGSSPVVVHGWRQTFASLTNRNFRLLWISMLFSFTAMQTTFIAQGLLTYRLTGTATSLGLVSLAWGLGQLPFTLVGGVAADRLNKRWLMVVSQTTLCLTAVALALLVLLDLIAVWQIAAIAVVSGAMFAFNVPARQAWIPEMVGSDLLNNAVALNTAAFTATGILGPMVAGVLIAVPGVDIAEIYYIVAACYAVVVVMLLSIPGGEPAANASRAHPVRELLDGLAYVRDHPVLPYLLVMGFLPIVLAMPFRSFFPVFQDEVYGVGDGWLGAMGAITAIGALISTLFVASLAQGAKRSAIQLAGVLGFGVSLIVFAIMPSLLPGLIALFFVGLASNAFWALNNTMLLDVSDKAYYGRVMSVYMLSWAVMPFVALPESALADRFGVQALVAGIGVTLIVVALAAVMLLPGHRRLQAMEGEAIAQTRRPA